MIAAAAAAATTTTTTTTIPPPVLAVRKVRVENECLRQLLLTSLCYYRSSPVTS